jgi:hypothetical protein
VAGAFEEEDGTRGGAEGRRGNGGVTKRCKIEKSNKTFDLSDLTFHYYEGGNYERS